MQTTRTSGDTDCEKGSIATYIVITGKMISSEKKMLYTNLRIFFSNSSQSWEKIYSQTDLFSFFQAVEHHHRPNIILWYHAPKVINGVV